MVIFSYFVIVDIYQWQIVKLSIVDMHKLCQLLILLFTYKNVSVSLIILGVWYINNTSSKVNICNFIYNRKKLNLHKKCASMECKVKNNKFKELVDGILSIIPKNTEAVKDDIKDNLKILLNDYLRKIDVVTREEFDAEKSKLLK